MIPISIYSLVYYLVLFNVVCFIQSLESTNKQDHSSSLNECSVCNSISYWLTGSRSERMEDTSNNSKSD